MEEKERYEYYFGTNSIKDNKTNKIYDYAVDLLNQQDKRIKELEEENKELEIKLDKCGTELVNAESLVSYLENENQQLKQQLHELPKKIVEDITNELSNNTSLYFEMRESTSAHCPNKEYEWFNYVRFRNYINKILKNHGGEDE